MNLRATGTALLPYAVALGLSALLLALQGIAPALALREFWSGSFGSADACAATAREWLPLSLCALGVALSFRAGLFNIGAEGQWVAGALAAVAIGGISSSPLLVLAAGTLAGATLGAVAALLRATRGISEILSTLMSNFVALELLSSLVTGPLRESSGQFPQTDPIPLAARWTSGLEIARAQFPFALLLPGAIAVLLVQVLARTRFGLLLRACASSPARVEHAGFRAARLETSALTASAALCGLAGAVSVAVLHPAVDLGLSYGVGYRAVAVALLAALSPFRVLAAALLFAALGTGSDSLQWAVDRPGLDRFAWIVQALLLLAVLARPRGPRLDSANRSAADG